MTNPHYTGQHSHQPAPRPKRWPWIVGIVAAFLLGVVLGDAGDGPQPAAAADGPRPAVPAPAGPDFSRGVPEGEWTVPDQVAPGRYRSTGAKPGIFDVCTATTRSAEGDVVDWRIANAGEQVLITVGAGVASFANANCEPFVRIG
ncbi:hypothetical protein BJF78_03500 [Pseudonocardia sp. CNS-139]|nr:hypothetical protein BJF78_03500 [Pseudonocardia sp. CNS-139]